MILLNGVWTFENNKNRCERYPLVAGNFARSGSYVKEALYDKHRRLFERIVDFVIFLPVGCSSSDILGDSAGQCYCYKCEVLATRASIRE